MPIASILYIIITNGSFIFISFQVGFDHTNGSSRIDFLGRGWWAVPRNAFFSSWFWQFICKLRNLGSEFSESCIWPLVFHSGSGEFDTRGTKTSCYSLCTSWVRVPCTKQIIFYVKCLDHFDIIQRLGKNSVLWWYDVRNYNASNRVIGHWSWAEHGTRFLRRKNLLILMARA